MGRSPDVQIEYLHHSRRNWQIFGLLAALALTLGAVALLGTAYAMQSGDVDDLKAQNERILGDHHAIGKQFTQQSKRLEEESQKLERAIRSSYGQGFLAGQQAARLPRGLRTLARYAAAGVLVPRRLPPDAGGRPRVERDLGGYTTRWPGLAVFASRIEPLSDWTRQALGTQQVVKLGPHRVQRFVGPTGVSFAWREQGITYAVIALPSRESPARVLISSMR